MKTLNQQLLKMTDEVAMKYGTGPYARPNTHHEGIGKHEVPLIQKLLSEGWTIYRNGWPDIVAIRGKEARLIEFKSANGELSKNQKQTHKILEKHFGVSVETVF